jgi:DNA-binding GntR family transcriptional regulator
VREQNGEQAPAADVQGHRTKSHIAAEYLRAAIRRGDLRPGERLTNREMCELLGMSPTPVREAMRMLEVEGLIVDEPHRGMSVARPTEGNLGELYDLRAHLEGHATSLATTRLTADDLAEIAAAAAAHHAARIDGDFPAAAERNYEFHTLIYRAANESPYLMEFIVRLWNVFPWNANWTLEMRTERAITEHAAILEALQNRDARAAERLMKRHILSTKPFILAAIDGPGGATGRRR